MNKVEKKEMAGALKEKFQKAKVSIFADYKGLESNQANDLRKQLRATNAEVMVLKNNIARVALKEGFSASAKEVSDSLVGPTLVAFAYGDPAAAAKVIHKFSTDFEALKLKDSLLGTEKISASAVEELAKLPGREVLLAKLLGTLNAPITNFVGVLAALPRSLVIALSEVQKQKEAGGN